MAVISTPSQRLAHAARFKSQPIRLIDGPLAPSSSIKQRLVARMAADLVEGKAFACEEDAIMFLRHKGYSPQNVFLLVGDAVCLAQQSVVAEAMSSL